MRRNLHAVLKEALNKETAMGTISRSDRPDGLKVGDKVTWGMSDEIPGTNGKRRWVKHSGVITQFLPATEFASECVEVRDDVTDRLNLIWPSKLSRVEEKKGS